MGGLFSKPDTPKMPEIKAKRMPVASDPSIQEAAMKRREMMRKRKGMMSTILSDSLSGTSGTLG